ncbi:hypothetical protein [Streptococcus pantholopis]|uniref:PH domain-containing protein n=1 Tax=Streptococcus pantholopis TaxID=1811193 RepID=A0A172Q5J1_9STRE|nr:hypothetical protein [Streptococcus pantholopis]AND78716.1 hypothetical protein A0O21_01065 [Streptococcus pantholopis]
MPDFRYRYRKTAMIWQAVIGFFFLGFVLFWLRAAPFILDSMTTIPGRSDSSLFATVGLNIFVLMTMIAAGLCLVISALLKLFIPIKVISGDEQGLTVRGPWLRSYHLSWGEIDYLRYEQRLIYHRPSKKLRTNFETSTSEILLIKPLQGKTVQVNITHLDGRIDDIVADIRSYLPNVKIIGLEI